jgi:hypothetical protein
MKRIIVISLTAVLVMFAVCPTQGTMNQAGTKSDNSQKTVSISGKVSHDGKTFKSDNQVKNWTVSNPDALQGYEGQHVMVTAHTSADQKEIYIVSVKSVGRE